jgi:hypothetical protein
LHFLNESVLAGDAGCFACRRYGRRLQQVAQRLPVAPAINGFVHVALPGLEQDDGGLAFLVIRPLHVEHGRVECVSVGRRGELFIVLSAVGFSGKCRDEAHGHKGHSDDGSQHFLWAADKRCIELLFCNLSVTEEEEEEGSSSSSSGRRQQHCSSNAAASLALAVMMHLL